MPSATKRAAMLAALLVTSCATPSGDPGIVLRVTDGPLWLRTEEIARYRCAIGLLVCQDAVGRRSARLCRCQQ